MKQKIDKHAPKYGAELWQYKRDIARVRRRRNLLGGFHGYQPKSNLCVSPDSRARMSYLKGWWWPTWRLMEERP